MRIPCVPCAILIALAMLLPHTASAYESSFGGQEQGKSQLNPQGRETIPPKPWELRPWEARPSETNQGEAGQDESRQGKERKAMEERRRVGRKARKEQRERKTENISETGSALDRVKQRQDKWRRHQMESERFYPPGTR